MKRIVASIATCTVLLGISFSIAAFRPYADVPSLTGKFVIVDIPGGLPIEVQEGVAFATVYGLNFVVIPLTTDEGVSYDYWVPADRIEGLKAFDSREEAAAYHEKHALWKKLRAARSSEHD